MDPKMYLYAETISELQNKLIENDAKSFRMNYSYNKTLKLNNPMNESCPKKSEHAFAAVPFVPVYIKDTEVIEGAIEILKTVRPIWDINFVKFKKFTDGITNKLVGCYYVNSLPKKNCKNWEIVKTEKDIDSSQLPQKVVLIRVYGTKSDILIDRQAEIQNFLLLHAHGLAPLLYATFQNGLVYEYIPGEILNIETVLCFDIWALVAKRMAQMHRIVKKMHDGHKVPMLWRKIKQFFDLIPTKFSDPVKQNRIASSFLTIERIREDFNNLQEHLSSLNSPIVFCHNDLLLGNIIYTKSSKTVNFIDYEYADYNYQAFDIGNHFAEMCGIDQVDYSLYPKKEFQMKWLHSYLQAYQCTNNVSNHDVKRLYVEVNKFVLAAHIFWTLWSLIQAEHSTIDFDYINYALVRYTEFLARKNHIMSMSVEMITDV